MYDHYMEYLEAYVLTIRECDKSSLSRGFSLAARALGAHHGKKDLPPLPYEGFCAAVEALMIDRKEMLAEARKLSESAAAL